VPCPAGFRSTHFTTEKSVTGHQAAEGPWHALNGCAISKALRTQIRLDAKLL